MIRNKKNLNKHRRTKIVATLGPASEKPAELERLLAAGANVVRINFSHGEAEQHKKLAELVRRCAKKLKQQEVGILADLQGPKIRIARFVAGKVALTEGAEFVLDAELATDVGDAHHVGIDYKDLPKDVHVGDTLLLDDGRIVLKVKQVCGGQICCKVKTGGELSNNKGINRLGGGLSAGALTQKDRQDILTIAAMPVDYVAISFPRSAADVTEAKKLLEKAGSKAGVIAKIERTEAVDVIDEIIEASAGVMVARGDLAVEIGDAEVPAVQKHIIQRARSLDKPVITATQMMETMIHSTVPTRAEVSDLANAILDGTDAVMLSAETAVGDHPDKVVATVSRICSSVEKHPNTIAPSNRAEESFDRVDHAIAMATMYTANHMGIKAIIALTESGITPLWMSRINTGIPIYGMSRHISTCCRMTLYRDVFPIRFDVTKWPQQAVTKAAVAELQKRGLVQKRDLVAITKGDYMGVHGGTNALKIVEVGKVQS